MEIREYLEELYKIKDLAVNRWGELEPIERQILDESFDWLVNNLEIKKGEIVEQDITKVMDDFLGAVVGIINENRAYQSRLSSFVADLTTLKKNSSKFYRTSFNLDIEKAGVTQAQKDFVGEVMNQYLENGLNQHFVSPLRDNIYRNILTGANMKEIRQVLAAYLISGKDESGKFGRYLKQTAQQAVDTYSGIINQKLVKQFKFTGYVISGSLIETSSEQCTYAVENAKNGYLSFEEWKKVLEMAADNKRAKLIEGTTLENLPINKLHWGCRHDFTPIIVDEKKTENKKEEKKQKPVGEKTFAELTMQELEDRIREQKFETASLYDKTGKQLFFKHGDKSSVSFTQEQADLMKGGIVTHNHPSSRSFSLADVNLFVQNEIQEIRAISKKYDYSLYRTEKTSKRPELLQPLVMEKYRLITKEIEEKLINNIVNNEITEDQANAEHHHFVMKELAEYFNFGYERKERK